MFKLDIPLSLMRQSVFLINLFLVLFIITSFFYGVDLIYFFYLNVLLTFVLSYLFFEKSKQLSKMLIITNMFLLFYFLSANIVPFIFELLRIKSYFFVILYNLIIGLIFLFFSGNHNCFQGNLERFNLKIFSGVLVAGVIFGFLFTFIREPVAGLVFDVYSPDVAVVVGGIASMAFLIALSEQIVFSAFFYNIYAMFVPKNYAIFYSATLFVLFHFLRIDTLSFYYIDLLGNLGYFFIFLYYLSLFFFMLFALYLYKFQNKKSSGIFLYPLALHFVADFVLFLQHYFVL